MWDRYRGLYFVGECVMSEAHLEELCARRPDCMIIVVTMRPVADGGLKSSMPVVSGSRFMRFTSKRARHAAAPESRAAAACAAATIPALRAGPGGDHLAGRILHS